MNFRTRIRSLMAGIVALVLVLVLAGWWAAGQMLERTDKAYQDGLQLAKSIDLARSAQVNFQRQVQEWKNILLRAGTADLRATHLSGFEKREAQMDRELQQLTVLLKEVGGMDEVIALASNTLAAHAELGQRYRAALAKHPAIDAVAQQAIDVQVRGIDRATSAGMDTLVETMQSAMAKRFAQEAQQAHHTLQLNFALGALVTLVLTALLLAGALLISRSVFNTLGADPEVAVAATARISRGDLTQRLNASRPHSLIGALEMMQSRLRNISLAIREVAFDIESNATAMPAGSVRDTLRSDVQRLRTAIDRLQVERSS